MATPKSWLAARLGGWIKGMVDESTELVGARLQESMHDDMNQFARMLRQQGDADNELAETFGRSLIRLSEAVEELRARLDRLETGEGQPTPSR
jgi:hypothetical protein